VGEAVNAGPHFSEPYLDMLLCAATRLGKLRAHAGAGAHRCIHHRRDNAVSRKSNP
jgi:hypothetical protein